jgi:fructose-bisphosphate aldolase class II
MLVPGRDLLAHAVATQRAVGSFNTYNLETTRAILSAAEALDQPVFLAAGRGALDYAGFELLSQAMLTAARQAKVAVAVHLDHSPDLSTISRCLDAGYTSVMIDGSALPFDDNLALTRDAAGLARGACIEAELGGIAGNEDSSGPASTAIPMTDPDQASRFVQETGVDSLAIAIGNAHGLYSGEPRLDFDRLERLAQRVPVPLVLHGASGISDSDLRRCTRAGIRKINVNTEIRVALFQSLASSLQRGVEGYDLTRLLGAAVEAMERVVEEKLAVFAAA